MGMRLPPELDAKIRAEADRQEAGGRRTSSTTPSPKNSRPDSPPRTDGRPAKYGNQKVETPDGKFDSKREHRRWVQLVALERVGAIQMLRRQVSFRLVVRGQLVCRYVADFTYVEAGRLVVEDAKGVPTDVYKLKKKLMRACLGIDIREV